MKEIFSKKNKGAKKLIEKMSRASNIDLQKINDNKISWQENLIA